jgi:hypothetical protein
MLAFFFLMELNRTTGMIEVSSAAGQISFNKVKNLLDIVLIIAASIYVLCINFPVI